MNCALQLKAVPAPDTDDDPLETDEWIDALRAVVQRGGPERARRLLDAVNEASRDLGVGWRPALHTSYCNTIPVERQAAFPGDLDIERRLASLMRWNALAMVVRANTAYGELGGHVASYASAADLFEVGFNHFFRASDAEHDGDLVFFQAHSAPGVYARAFLEGRLTENDLSHYRQEIVASSDGARGLSSYPHPYLMPDFWQFPTGSMGIGPISSIYQARFMRYLSNRRLLDCTDRKVWGIFGDGEMDEPESVSALTLAAREQLDNLIWVVNCNLQRLDGPVRGNGRIIDELERLFTGAGWNVVKLVWGSDWDGLFAKDRSGALLRAFAGMVDGEMQTLAARDGRFNREMFFSKDAALQTLVSDLSDDQIDRLTRGGHDLVKIHAAYRAAADHRGGPTVILAHTMKGYGMGVMGQGRMTTHSQKKFEAADLLAFRDRFALPLNDEDATSLSFCRPSDGAVEMRYLRERRRALGGSLPSRRSSAAPLPVPPIDAYARFALDAAGKAMSTTMAFVRILGALLKDRELGPRIVPIVADEARTFGMANLFKQVGIYSSIGQRYDPEDLGSVLSYREAVDGQLLEEGISEAGALASWTAAATSYSVHSLSMLPFYIYYSMFGFQRVGDQIWAAADQRARGFLIGATAGRTTLSGEGLQHQDGSSHLVAATIPNCKAYDPAFAGELAMIVDEGMREMLVDQHDVFYYVTVMNANYDQPSVDRSLARQVVRGGYRYEAWKQGTAPVSSDAADVTLLGSGAILLEVASAARTLTALGHRVEVFSITSWSELARDGQRAEREGNMPFVAELLGAAGGPVVAASDYVRAVPEAIRPYIPSRRSFVTLGTDGFGRSDTRAALRRFFGVDADAVVKHALQQIENGTKGGGETTAADRDKTRRPPAARSAR